MFLRTHPEQMLSFVGVSPLFQHRKQWRKINKQPEDRTKKIGCNKKNMNDHECCLIGKNISKCRRTNWAQTTPQSHRRSLHRNFRPGDAELPGQTCATGGWVFRCELGQVFASFGQVFATFATFLKKRHPPKSKIKSERNL